MRQRPVDVNQTTLFVDTQPRPVTRGGSPRRLPNRALGVRWQDSGGGDQMTETTAWALFATSLVLLLGGVYLVRGNHYAHLHRRIQDAYYEHLQAWKRGLGEDFAATSWELLVQGREQPLPLQPDSRPSKRIRSRPDSASSTPDNTTLTAAASEPVQEEQQPKLQQRQRQKAKRRRGTSQAALLEFRVEGLMQTLHPARVPLMDQHHASHSRLWRPVVPELRHPVALSLRGTDSRTGAVSVVDLGQVAFTRERTVPAAGEGRCVYEEKGVWQPDETCSVSEYLWGLCVKVARDDASGAYTADSATGGGPGCGPEWGWEVGQWRRLDERNNRINGRVYLPLFARNCTIVTVRHGRDPDLLESDLVARLAPNVEQQILFHAVGLAMCFLGLVLLLSVGVFAAPALARRVRAAWSLLCSRRRRRLGVAAGSDGGER